MTSAQPNAASPYPSVDRVARLPELAVVAEAHGWSALTEMIRRVLDELRARARAGANDQTIDASEAAIARVVTERLAQRAKPALRRVFNLTGTVLHTNLGRALLPEAAIEHAAMAMRNACNLEFDLTSGGRGERDTLVEELIIELTGAEAALVVNNNAAAVLLVLAALAGRREVILSRGELVEIGGAFRIPDVMRSAGARLVEIGTTNRTHLADYRNAIGPKTAALMKVHTSNYTITGFVASVDEPALAELAHAHQLPFFIDLGAGSLIDLTAYGLPREPMVSEAIAAGGDVVTFSGDKLLGGPQAGLVVGKKALIDRIRRHPLKRALRVSKLTLAALEATLQVYRHPEQLAQRLPTLRLLTRSVAELQPLAERLVPHLTQALGSDWQVSIASVSSQVGSGSLPVETLPSVALALRPEGRRQGAQLNELARRLRRLDIPVIGRVHDGALILDLRCLEEEAAFIQQIGALQM